MFSSQKVKNAKTKQNIEKLILLNIPVKMEFKKQKWGWGGGGGGGQ